MNFTKFVRNLSPPPPNDYFGLTAQRLVFFFRSTTLIIDLTAQRLVFFMNFTKFVQNFSTTADGRPNDYYDLTAQRLVFF